MRNSGPLIAVLVLMLITGGVGGWFLLFRTDPMPAGSGTTDANPPRSRLDTRRPADPKAGDRDQPDRPKPEPNDRPVEPDRNGRSGPDRPDPDSPTRPVTAPTRPAPEPSKPATDQPTEADPAEEEYAELDKVDPLPPIAGVWGQVAGVDGRPIGGVELHLLLLRPSGFVPAAFARTQSDGMFAIGSPELLAALDDFDRSSTGFTPRPIQPGRYRIEARARGRQMSAAEVELKGSLVRKDLRMPDEGFVTITLQCFNTNGQTPSQPQVTISQRDGGDGGAHSSRFAGAGRPDSGSNAPMRTGESLITIPGTPQSGQRGVFTLQVKALADVELTVVQSGYRCINPQGGKFKLDLSDGTDRTLQLEFDQLPPGVLSEPSTSGGSRYGDQSQFVGDATISGTVSLGFAGRISTVSIELRRDGMQPRQIRLDPATGEFEFAGVSNGVYQLVLSSNDFQSFPTRTLEVKSQREFVDWVVGRSPLSIRLDGDSEAYMGSILMISSEALGTNRPLLYKVIDHTAPAITPATTEGEYWVDLHGVAATLADAEADGRVYFDVPGNGATVAHSLKVAKPGSVTWQVLDGQGYGWAGSEVRVVRRELMDAAIRPAHKTGAMVNWDRTRLVPVDNLGRGGVERIAPGEYSALVWTRSNDPNLWDREVRFVVEAGEAVNLGTIGSK